MGLGDSPAIVHHMKLGTGASDLRYGVSEIDLLAMTLEALA